MQDINLQQPVPTAIIESLQSVLEDLDGYLAQWSQRLDQQLAAEIPSVASDSTLQGMIEEFQREKSEWKLKREREDEQIREKFEQLTSAWLHLEAEQRRFLQLKPAHQNATSETSAPTVPCPTAKRAAGARPEPLTGGCDPAADASSPCASTESQTQPSADNAVMQFHKLRKQIQSSRRFEV